MLWTKNEKLDRYQWTKKTASKWFNHNKENERIREVKVKDFSNVSIIMLLFFPTVVVGLLLMRRVGACGEEAVGI